MNDQKMNNTEVEIPTHKSPIDRIISDIGYLVDSVKSLDEARLWLTETNEYNN